MVSWWSTVLLAEMISSGSLRAPASPPTPPATVLRHPSSAASRPSSAKSVLPDVAECVSLLARDRLTIAEVAERVGRIESDPGMPLPIVLTPRHAGVRGVRLTQSPAGVPYLLVLEPARAARPTVGELVKLLGPFRRAPAHREHPNEIVFSPVAPSDASRRIQVFAAVEDGDDDDDPVTRITFLRDAK